MASTESPSGLVHVVYTFAGIMLIIAGAFQVIEAIAALVNDEYILVLPNYVFSLDLTGWGVIHLLIGLILAAIGVVPALRKRMGQDRRHRGGRHLSSDQLLLASVRAVVGHPVDRPRRAGHLGAGVRPTLFICGRTADCGSAEGRLDRVSDLAVPSTRA